MFGVPKIFSEDQNTFIFMGTPSITDGVFCAWQKPHGIEYIYILAIGGGGGGAGGATGSPGLERPGGGGGGSGGITCGMFPASFLPDTLYIRAGEGGAGGSALSAGSAGKDSVVGLYPFANTTFNSSIRNNPNNNPTLFKNSI